MDDILFEILKMIVTISVILIMRYFIPFMDSCIVWIKAKIAESNNQILITAANTAVQYAEQTIKGSGIGAEKKAEALKVVQNELNAKGIEITDEQMDTLVEAAVYTMNKEKSDNK